MPRSPSRPQIMSAVCALTILAAAVPAAAFAEVSAQPKVPASPPAITAKLATPPGIAGNVHCGVQDKTGNIWFTGAKGVYRFDGTAFTNFTTDHGLCDNSVNVIILNRAGHIIFGTRRGICAYDGATFSTYKELGEPTVTSLFEDKDGVLWFGAMARGLYRYDGKTLQAFLESGEFNLGNTYQLILDIAQDQGGNLWFTSWNGGGVWRYDGKSFTNFLPSAGYYRPMDGFVGDGRTGPPPPTGSEYPHISKNIPDDMIFCAATDSHGRLWFGTRRHGISRYDPASGEFTTFREKEGFVSDAVYAILEDRHGDIWLTTDKSGVWRYDGKAFANFTTSDGLVHNSVFSILEDKDGNLWFGTRGFGLSRYDGMTFTTFSE